MGFVGFYRWSFRTLKQPLQGQAITPDSFLSPCILPTHPQVITEKMKLTEGENIMDRKKMALTVSTEFGEKHVLFVLRNYETVGQTGSPGM